ncbi:molybdenum cofactor guanylyltransferase [Marinobacter daqiaonensis]|uniref:Molybdenum cofactor guanylyltransferase n=1 Tax=Marinobacter daqiaonensis TaxID=650891 RepID=A0A1I6I270_9GAMM|nr:molybdenum cofactor guanylyltransferase MobA [Marinobacter daqiaonensis]SFR60801.1 molybdenum cofactor guanylyltransferase [Marinobacter daqiaonensis]
MPEMMADETDKQTIAGLILAGGEGRRMGGADKGLVEWQGRPLVAWVLDAMTPVVSPVWISANRSHDRYRGYSSRLVSDAAELRWQGPMAGLLAGLQAAASEGFDAVLVSPCDTPGVTPELFRALYRAYQAAPGVPVIVSSGGRQHPLHGVYPVSLATMVARRLKAGDRRVMAFAGAAGARSVSIEPESLLDNINRLEDGKAY